MATGVKPREEDIQLTRSDLDAIQDAMKNKKFRDMLADYCDEIRDPANQALYQKEMTQLEKERGYDITFINPKGGYVIKTSVAGDQKAFINICSNENVAKPSCNSEVMDGRRGLNWQIPYSMIPPRHDYDNKRVRCVIYDVVFHPDTLRMAEVNQRFRELVNKTAFDGLRKTYNIHLDDNNCRFPRSQYKGANTQAVIRKEDPNYVPLSDEDTENFTPEMMEKLYPQKFYHNNESKPSENQPHNSQKRKQKPDYNHALHNGFTVPKYIIKQQKNIDLQDYTYNKDCKQYSAIPSQIVVEINLPLLSSTEHCILDVQEKSLSLKSEKPAKYKLNIDLPYPVNDECGSAKFDKSKHTLTVTLPVIKRDLNQNKAIRVDSGVESEENSGSQSDEEHKEDLIVEIASTPALVSPILSPKRSSTIDDSFLDSTLAYSLPTYTKNVLDDIVAFTFHVKNTEPDSVKVKKDGNRIFIKFTTIGSGFVPVHYAAIIVLDDNISFENVSGEAWDNNVILQLELTGDAPQKFYIGLDIDNMTCEYFDVDNVKKGEKQVTVAAEEEETQAPLVEITNLGSQTNIVVSTGNSDYEEDDYESSTPRDNENDNVFTYTPSLEHGAKSILRNGSSVGDVASSMDYISSDYVPEESSLKKTVRFNKVIAKQFYRYNSSIEGQKKKNQKKKFKKRQLERRKSESEAEEDITNNNSSMNSRPKLKSALKIRRDSGLADTSDADEAKNQTPNYYQKYIENDKHEAKETVKSVLNIVDNEDETVKTELDLKESNSQKIQRNSDPITCDSIKHKTDLYDPKNLNKGKYLEVSFKNDLIFDLDM